MKHFVICSMGDGDEIRVVHVAETMLDAMRFAKKAAIEVANDLHDDEVLSPAQASIAARRSIKEQTFVPQIGDDYEYFVEIEGAGLSWTVHGDDLA